MMSLVAGEIARRNRPIIAIDGPMNAECDGVLAAPIPGLAPFNTPDRMFRELSRIADLNGGTRERMLSSILAHLAKLPQVGFWRAVEQYASDLRRAIGSAVNQ